MGIGGGRWCGHSVFVGVAPFSIPQKKKPFFFLNGKKAKHHKMDKKEEGELGTALICATQHSCNGANAKSTFSLSAFSLFCSFFFLLCFCTLQNMVSSASLLPLPAPPPPHPPPTSPPFLF